MTSVLKLTTLALPVTLAMFASDAAAQEFRIEFFAIASGGGTSSEGAYDLSGTIGQHDAHRTLPSVIYRVAGGFWRSSCPADFDDNCLVNSQDFFAFLEAFFRGDETADFNGDSLINSQDFFEFLAAFFSGC